MTLAELQQAVADALDGWPLGELRGPESRKGLPDPSIDSTAPAMAVQWLLDDEFGERLTRRMDLFRGSVVLLVQVQTGAAAAKVAEARAEARTRFRTTSSELIWDPPELGEELVVEGLSGWDVREIRLPYRRQEEVLGG